MSQHVAMGAVTKCSFGEMPSALMVIPKVLETSGGPPGATILDSLPFANVLPFGMCSCIGNPVVAALTAAAMGELVPGPCMPMTTSPWFPGSPKVLLGGLPALTRGCKLICDWGGLISIEEPGQFAVDVA